MKKIAIFILIMFLVGCGQGLNKPLPIVKPTNIEIFNMSDADEVIVGGETLNLTALVYPSNAEAKVIWSSSDTSIASITQDGVVTGLQEGQVTITAISDVDATIYGEIKIFVYDDASNLKTIENIKVYLEELIPSQTSENLDFVYNIDGARLTWSTSDENTISRTGKVKRALKNRTVTLTCKISSSRMQGEFKKEVMVNKYELKSRDRKLAFTYLYDYGNAFKGFNEGDLDKIDVINYSFGGIRDGKMIVGNNNFETIIKLAHDKGVRVVLAIGGWGVDGFSDAALTKESRKVFIDSIMEGIEKYRLDGIDFDWEYPTSTASGLIKARPEDKVNFTLLCKELREAMNKVNEDLILSIAVANGAWAAQTYYEVDKLNNYIDYLHLMSYDIINFGTQANPVIKASHHTNLYSSSNSIGSADAGVKAYLNNGNGIDPHKIIMGIAFYGHVFKVDGSRNNGMGQNCDTSVEGNKFTVSYKKIVEEYLKEPEIYTVHKDEQAKANWIYGNNTVISYDDPYSIAEKIKYVNNQNLGGVMVWEYTKDDSQSSLINAINDNLNIQK